MRVLLHTGKGGVGKTSLALATALAAAEHGHRVFVLSTDASHSLGDALGRRVGPEVSQFFCRAFGDFPFLIARIDEGQIFLPVVKKPYGALGRRACTRQSYLLQKETIVILTQKGSEPFWAKGL